MDKSYTYLSGVGAVEKQTKTVTIAKNGTVEIIPDAGKIIEKVSVAVVVPDEDKSDLSAYYGDYVVVPDAESDIELPTAETILGDNIIIRKIPYSETKNQSGGTTVTIGY